MRWSSRVRLCNRPTTKASVRPCKRPTTAVLEFMPPGVMRRASDSYLFGRTMAITVEIRKLPRVIFKRNRHWFQRDRAYSTLIISNQRIYDLRHVIIDLLSLFASRRKFGGTLNLSGS